MSVRKYIRDGRAPVPKDARTSALMSRIRAKDTSPERALRRALRDAGHRGYRLHYAKVPGRPDIAFVGRKVAVFVHGCFWHGCPYCRPARPRTHRRFWNEKLDRNKDRDKRKARTLRQAGWLVVTIWECRLKKDPIAQLRRVENALENT
ncbi:MAG: very short patch repair endonuclease [Flavobacteriales bacterium]|nr:very short patch repair endonuclease [Flavobacteriales bacterium]